MLAVIPAFHDTVDKAMSYLAEEGLIGIADFYVSSKWDLPLRQMPWSRRFFWRCAFPAQRASCLALAQTEPASSSATLQS